MKDIIRKILGSLGYQIRRIPDIDPSDRLAAFFAGLKRAGFNPSEIYDVGAHVGEWTKSALNYFPDSRYLLFEPQSQLKKRAHKSVKSNSNVIWHHSAVSDFVGTADFTIADRLDSSSLVTTMDEPQAVKQVPVEVTTLDDIVSKNNGRVPQIVKIDAEGNDLKVLDGSRNLLGVTDVFFVEAAICCPRMENTLLKVIDRMEREGYKIVGITSLVVSPASGELWLVEAAFVRDKTPLYEYFSTFD